ncbi:IclR family transcriptional regulator [Pseudonocardia sulfidoxydans NBRC 16205]|uniref:Glycerol operon regulatory protein n=1 Tax=Pseudonocardia sulfidoxydans NBRC 16205 TaxID=1223511 RepID=A0A511DRV1_9PSEU|nr:IclR family transcriptional regulator [Pseudonocardia sulfidoxydans]GEL26943.1 IclR family transcriptional regulator [Pseudonocardia sulfidoxydans NBRC 16205]
MPRSPSTDKAGLTSVRNALSVLNLLSDGVELRVVDVARSLGVAVSTAHRLMATLVEEGFLRQSPNSRRYLVGPAALRLGRAVSYEQTLRRFARPYLQTLCRELNETINLQILVGADVYFLLSAEDRHQLRVAQREGSRLPARATAGGKVLLAAIGDPVSAGWGSDMRIELTQVRSNGYAVNLSDVDDSVRAIAVPVREPDGECLAALSLAAPTVRLPDVRLPLVLTALQRAATEIGRDYAGKWSPTG